MVCFNCLGRGVTKSGTTKICNVCTGHKTIYGFTCYNCWGSGEIATESPVICDKCNYGLNK